MRWFVSACLIAGLAQVAPAATATLRDDRPTSVAPDSRAATPGFYDTSHLARKGRPGTVVRWRPMSARILPGVPMPAHAWRMLYRSRGATGRPQIVSGTVLVPTRPWRGAGPRPLVGYALGTPGMADRCAPSRQFAAGTEYEATVVAWALQRGWALALTDYPGLGTPGDHQYVVGRSLGRAVLDSMRAARRLRAAHLSPHGPTAIYGYSEGGEAAGWALQLAERYAPDLHVRGGAVGAPPADFLAEYPYIDRRPFSFLLGYVSMGFAAAYPELRPLLRRSLTAKGRRYFALLDRTCLIEAIVRGQAWPKNGDVYFKRTPLDIPQARRRLRSNNLGGIAPGVPVILAANTHDEVMHYATAGPGLRDKWCARGAHITLRSYSGAEHLSGVFVFWGPASRFLADRLAGRPSERAADCRPAA